MIDFRSYFSRKKPEREEYYRYRLCFPDERLIGSLHEPSVSPLYTTVKIEYEKNIFGCPEIALLKTFGKPDYILNFGKHIYSVLFHKQRFETYKVLRQTHFLNNSFFYACDTYKNLHPQDEHSIICTILKNYVYLNEYAKNEFVTIYDTVNNKIAIRKDVYLKVHYLKGMFPAKHELAEFWTDHYVK